jgi:hypothetical protein
MVGSWKFGPGSTVSQLTPARSAAAIATTRVQDARTARTIPS